jgi:hypothetical protein
VTRQTALGAFHESKSDLSGVSFGQGPSLPAEELHFLHHSPGATDRPSSLPSLPSSVLPTAFDGDVGLKWASGNVGGFHGVYEDSTHLLSLAKSR